jgi:TolB-like protein/Tfp pilus assembly protein PilF
MAPSSPALTDAGVVMGTAPYMSPEQANGLALDARTDIFSLGAVLYEIATGRRPFGGNTRAETISSILRDTPRPVTEARQDAPRHLGRIISHCLQKEPRDRFQTARDVYNELRDLCKEVESGASEVTGAPSTRPTAGLADRASSPTAGSTGASAASAGVPVTRGAPSTPHSAAQPTPSGATAPGTRGWIWAIAGAAVVIIAMAAFWLGSRRMADAPEKSAVGGTRAAGAPVVTETNSLAVLPFANMSSDKDQEYFSDGLTEELLNALAKIPDLKVAGRTSSFSFKGKNEDLRTIGEKLGVANILEGSVRKSGNRVRITAQLVKASDGFHLWSETYDRTLDDIFAVQDDIAKAVTQSLKVTLLGPGPKEQPNAEAYDLVLRARYMMQANSEEATLQARKTLERALELSPDYAPAWAEMGLAFVREQERATSVEAGQQAIQRAREALGKALELDPNLASAHSRLANVQQSAWEFSEAERSMAKALAADPKNPIVLGNAALLYGILGRFTDAISLTEQATTLDPLTPIGFSNLANFYLMVGRLDEAEANYRKAIKLRPDHPLSHMLLGILHLLRGRPEEARSSMTKFTDLQGLGDYGRLYFDALVEHTAKNAEASKRATEEFEKRFGADDPSSCSQIRAWRGEADAAFAWLDRAVARRDPLLSQIKFDPLMIPLHSDPRWNALMKKIGLPTD